MVTLASALVLCRREALMRRIANRGVHGVQMIPLWRHWPFSRQRPCRLQASHAVVVLLAAVGSWVAEACGEPASGVSPVLIMG